MRCLLCEEFSLSHICSPCQKTFLTPSIYKRKLTANIEVISFYKYQDIKNLLHTKHTDVGYYIYNILAKKSFKKFVQNFEIDMQIASLSIDDTIKSGYSHTAILNKALQSKQITPYFHKLRAKNSVSYSGKTKAFRLMNPRDFQLEDFKEKSVIVVDDIITTGATLTQAVESLQEKGKEILFCLTLADVSQK